MLSKSPGSASFINSSLSLSPTLHIRHLRDMCEAHDLLDEFQDSIRNFVDLKLFIRDKYRLRDPNRKKSRGNYILRDLYNERPKTAVFGQDAKNIKELAKSMGIKTKQAPNAIHDAGYLLEVWKELSRPTSHQELAESIVQEYEGEEEKEVGWRKDSMDVRWEMSRSLC